MLAFGGGGRRFIGRGARRLGANPTAEGPKLFLVSLLPGELWDGGRSGDSVVCECLCVCELVCMCVCERERQRKERQKEKERKRQRETEREITTQSTLVHWDSLPT